MQKIQNLLQVCMGCYRKVSKKAYSTCAIITTGTIVIAVISMSRTDFGGSGKNIAYVEAKSTQTYTTGDDEDEAAVVTQSFSLLNAKMSNSGDVINQSLEEFINDANRIIPREISYSTSQSNEITIDENTTKEVYSLPSGIAINELEFEVTEVEYEALLKMVEAEATDEDLKGRILIANVIFNRVRWGGFPSTVYKVIHQQINGKNQFSPLTDGRYYSVKVSDLTKKAVELAIDGIDYSDGALFFAARKRANPNNMSWFDTKLNYLFKYGTHEFFSYN